MDKEDRQLWVLFIITFAIGVLLMGMVRCTSVPSKEIVEMKPQISPIITPQVPQLIKLSWESPKFMDRVNWSKELLNSINDNFSSLDKARDIKRFCPTYSKLDKQHKMQAWAELFVSLSEFESSWNPSDSEVDVGEVGNKNSYSVGLFQISQTDIKNYNIKNLNYTYEDLLRPEPNIKLALALMAHQIDKHGLIIVEDRNFVYWITLFESWTNWNDKTDQIISHVKHLDFCK